MAYLSQMSQKCQHLDQNSLWGRQVMPAYNLVNSGSDLLPNTNNIWILKTFPNFQTVSDECIG